MPHIDFIGEADYYNRLGSSKVRKALNVDGNTSITECDIDLNNVNAVSPCRITVNPDVNNIYKLVYKAPEGFARETRTIYPNDPWLMGLDSMVNLNQVDVILPLIFETKNNGSCFDSVTVEDVNELSGSVGDEPVISEPYMSNGFGFHPGSDDGFTKTPNDGLERRVSFYSENFSWMETSTSIHNLYINYENNTIRLISRINVRQSHIVRSVILETTPYDADRPHSVATLWTPQAASRIEGFSGQYIFTEPSTVHMTPSSRNLEYPTEDDFKTFNPRYTDEYIYSGEIPNLTDTQNDILIPLSFNSGSTSGTGAKYSNISGRIVLGADFTQNTRPVYERRVFNSNDTFITDIINVTRTK